MDFAFGKEQEKLRQDIRAFLDKELTPEILKECEQYYGTGPNTLKFKRKLGAKGWLAANWPKEYGGLGRSFMDKLILREELSSAGVNIDMTGVNIVGPVIMRHGNEGQKKEFLLKTARGECEFALGYTEPNAGADLASLEMRAIRDGNEYVISGQKVYSTSAHEAEYHWLAVRTDTNAAKHRGISVFIVDLRKTPGITVRPLLTIAGEQTNEVFYDEVRVPKEALVGEENQGWHYILEALAYERTMVVYIVNANRILGKLIQYVKETNRNGKPLSEDPFVRQALAQLAIEINAKRLHSYRTAWLDSKEVAPLVEAAELKVWGHELDQRMAKAGMEILGIYSQLEPESKWAPLNGLIEHLYRFAIHLSYGGGSHELMRVLIAMRGMGLPRG